MSNLNKTILEGAGKLQQELLNHRRYLHQNAEVGFDLPVTKAYVKEQLTKMGYQPQDCGKAGVVVLAGGKKPGKVFLIRGDMDALPIQEQSGVEFSSKTCNMHACGHDMHTSMMLGAAKLLKEHEDEIEGTVKLMFQPAEEPLTGAADMIANGVLENPTVDAGMMIHVSTGMPVPEGMCLLPEAGPGASASDWFEIHIQGKGGHGAMPNACVDPVNVAAHIHIALQEINSREVTPGENMVLTVGHITGGTTSNVIPDTAAMYGTLRTFDPEVRSFVKQRMEEISKSVAQAFRAEATVTFPIACPALVNDKDVMESAEKYMEELVGPQGFISARKAMPGKAKMSGSEDFGFVSEKIPVTMMMLGAGTPANGYVYPQHHPKARFDDTSLQHGVAAYVYIAMRWLEEHK